MSLLPCIPGPTSEEIAGRQYSSPGPASTLQGLEARLAADPGDVVAYSELWMRYRGLRREGGLTEYARLIARGNVLREHGDVPGAEHAFREAIACRPQAPFAYARLGDLLRAAGRFSDAAQALAVAGERGHWLDTLMRFDAAHMARVALVAANAGGPALVGNLVPATADVVVLVACDPVYLARFGSAFVGSALRNLGVRFHLHLHVSAPDPSVDAPLDRIQRAVGHDNFTCTVDDPDLSGLPAEAKKTYFACARYLHLPALLAHYARPVLMFDIDILILKPLAPRLSLAAAADVGVIALPPYGCDLWGALSAAFISMRPTDFALQVARQTRAAILDAFGQGRHDWFLDQIALFCALASHWAKGPEGRIQLFDSGAIESESHLDGQPSLATDPVLWSVTASIASNVNKTSWSFFRQFELL